jgi:hypothetical protein
MKVEKVLRESYDQAKNVLAQQILLEAASNLSDKKQFLYFHIVNEMDRIIEEIEKESGWRFIEKSFILLSDYFYNTKTE